MNGQVVVRALAVAASATAVAVLTPIATADAVYHTERLELAPVAGAPLRSGFVVNSKAEGPRVYARETFVLNGAAPNAAYTFKRNFFFRDCGCKGDPSLTPVARLETNAAGNVKGDLVIVPDEVPPPYRGKHGVLWTVEDAAGTIVYHTACTAVTLD
jgi:hypothetical protein